MTISNLSSMRELAGQRYAAALQEFRAAFTDLAAIDAALVGKTTEQIRSFGTFPDVLHFRHPVFAPNVGGHLPSEATELRNQYLKVEGL